MPFGLDTKSLVIGAILGLYVLPMLLGMIMSMFSQLTNPAPKKSAAA